MSFGQGQVYRLVTPRSPLFQGKSKLSHSVRVAYPPIGRPDRVLPPGVEQEAAMSELATLGAFIEPLDALAHLLATGALAIILVELAVLLGYLLGIGQSETGHRR